MSTQEKDTLWGARIRINEQLTYIGSFGTEEAAAKARPSNQGMEIDHLLPLLPYYHCFV